MKKLYLIYISILLLFLSGYYGCNTTTSVAYPPGIVYGIVLDSATHRPIDSVYVNTSPLGYGEYSDSAGRFRVSYISMPSSGVTLSVIAGKAGYLSDTVGVWLLSNDSVYVRMVLMPSNGVLLADNVVLQQYSNQQTYSSLDLISMSTVQGQNPYRDIDLRDSMGLGQRFQLKSAITDPLLVSLDTRFGNSLGNFSKYDFDTLRMIYGVSGALNDSYFPNNQTPFFLNPVTENSVYPFYLAGRYSVNPGSPKIFGLLYIYAVWTDPGSNSVMVRVDIKENRNGQNYFVTQ